MGRARARDLAATIDPAATISSRSRTPRCSIRSAGKAIAARDAGWRGVAGADVYGRAARRRGRPRGAGRGAVGAPGAGARSMAPGIESGVHRYAYTFTTACGRIAAESDRGDHGRRDRAAGRGAEPGRRRRAARSIRAPTTYAVTFVTASGETTTPGVTQSRDDDGQCRRGAAADESLSGDQSAAGRIRMRGRSVMRSHIAWRIRMRPALTTLSPVSTAMYRRVRNRRDYPAERPCAWHRLRHSASRRDPSVTRSSGS